jgi:hypothetical protein
MTRPKRHPAIHTYKCGMSKAYPKEASQACSSTAADRCLIRALPGIRTTGGISREVQPSQSTRSGKCCTAVSHILKLLACSTAVLAQAS